MLGTQGTVEQTYVLDAVVFGHAADKPRGPSASGQFAGIILLEEMLDTASAHGYVDDAHLDVFGQSLHHRTSEVVTGTQSCVHAIQWRGGPVPFVFLSQAASVVACCGWLVNGRHHAEARTHALVVAILGLGIAHHIGLSEGQEDIERGVRLEVEVVCLELIAGGAGGQEHLALSMQRAAHHQ